MQETCGAQEEEKMMSVLYELEVLFAAPTSRGLGPRPAILALEDVYPLP